MLNRLIESTTFVKIAGTSIVASVTILTSFDTTLPKWLRAGLVISMGTAAWTAKQTLAAKDSTALSTLLENNVAELRKQAIIDNGSLPNSTKSDLVESHDSSLLTKILLSQDVSCKFIETIDAPRFERFLFKILNRSQLPDFNRLAKRIHLGMGTADKRLSVEPLVTIDSGFLAVDIPKENFDPITYSDRATEIQQAIHSNKRVIGLSHTGSLIVQDRGQFAAFTMVGGKTRSGKSVWIRQTCLDAIVSDSTGVFYCIDFKVGTFDALVKTNRLEGNTIAYDEPAAAKKITAIHRVLHQRMQEEIALNGEPSDALRASWNTHYLFIDEYKDGVYTPLLEQILKKGAAYKIVGVIGTQQFNVTKSSSTTRVTSVIVDQSSTKICFLVDREATAKQIIGNTDPLALLGKGDGFYKADTELHTQRFQSVFYTDEEIREIIQHIGEPVSSLKDTYQSMSDRFIKPPTFEWNVYQTIQESKKPLSVTTVARSLNASRESEKVLKILNSLAENGLLRSKKAPNGKGLVYHK